jgi:hypothetical protein
MNQRTERRRKNTLAQRQTKHDKRAERNLEEKTEIARQSYGRREEKSARRKPKLEQLPRWKNQQGKLQLLSRVRLLLHFRSAKENRVIIIKLEHHSRSNRQQTREREKSLAAFRAAVREREKPN